MTSKAAYLPRCLLESLRGQSGPASSFSDAVPGTLLMADVSGFTALSERLARGGKEGAERLTDVINRFFTRVLDAPVGLDGDVLTFAGDAVLVLFRGEDHADRAAGAGLEMLSATAKMPAVEAGGRMGRLGMSIGIHSGSFLTVAAGDPNRRMQLIFVGPETERVAKAEQVADQGQLAASPSTASLLGDRWIVCDMPGAPDHFRLVDSTAGDWVSPRVHGHPPGQRKPARGASAAAPGQAPAASRARAVPTASVEAGPGSARLLPFLPPWVADAVRTGRPVTPGAPEHRRATVVFVNVIGVSELLVTEGQDAVGRELQTYMFTLTSLLEKHHGYLVSSDIGTVGFKLLLSFGAPVAHEYAAANAARFALEFDEQLRGGVAGRLRHRMGINGGHVFAGEVGPEFRRQYTVMGDEVNLAARLMAAADWGQIMVSQGLAELMGGDFALRGLDPIRVKGKERPVEVCLLEGSAAAKGRPCEPAIKKGAIFGREAELAAVATAWKKTRSGRGAAVLIVGEAGVGKTTVLEHAVASISRRNPILRTACYEYLQAVPYAPWVELLEQAFGTIRTETIDARTGKVRAWLGENAPHLEEFAALLNPIMAVSLEMGDVVRSLDGRARRERLHSLVGDLLVAAGRRRAHAIVLEDLHWADESTLALLRDVSPALGAAPVLLLATARPCEGLTELRPVAQALDLEELSAADSAAMVRAALGRPDLRDVLVDFVYEKTRGNPLFTEEVTRELALPGVLDRILHASAVNLAEEVAALGIPDRVQGLFMSQIDRLSPETREVAKAASVVGRMFTKDELRGMGEASLGATSLDAALSELAASSLVLAESSSDGGSYRFRHALVQQVAYDSLPFARRRELHSAVARFIEAAGAVPDDGVLVHHYRNAGDRLELRSHATRAAQSSMAAYGYREAVDYLDLALGTVRGRRPVDANARSRLHELSADCHGSLGSQDQAISNYVRALHSWKSPRARSASLNLFPELPSLTAPDEREAELCRKIALAALRSFTNQEEALRWANRAEACVPQDRPGLASEIAEVRTVAFCRAGRYQDALKMGEESLVLARQSGDEALLALALNGLANACIWLGLFARGVEACTEGVRLCQKTGDLSLEATAHCNLAICYDAGGDFAKALHHHQLSLALSRRLGDMTAAARTETNISALYLNLSSPAEAAFYAREAIGHQGEDAAPNLLGCAWLNLGRAQVLLGDTEDAQSSLARARALLRKANASGILLDVDLEEARLDLVRGDVEAARSKTKVVLVGARQAQSWFTEIDSLLLLGSLELKAQDVQAAREAIDAALARAGEMGADHERGRGLLLLAELQAGAAGTSEEPATALATLDEARALFRRMGAKEDLAQTRRLRARIVRGRAANR